MQSKIEKIKESFLAINEYRVLATFIASLVIFMSVIGLVVIPCWQAQVLYEGEASVLEKKQKAWESFASTHKEYAKDYDKLQTEVKGLRLKLPQKLEAGAAMARVQGMANSSKVRLKAVQQGIMKSKGLMTTNIDIEARGEYGNILHFLQLVEEKQLAGLENLSLKSNAQGELILQGQCKSFAWAGNSQNVTRKV